MLLTLSFPRLCFRKSRCLLTATCFFTAINYVGRLFNEVDDNRDSLPANYIFRGQHKCKQLHKPSQSEIRYRHTYWQVQQDGQEDIVVYSAFYDNRPIVGVLPWIRILGVRRLSAKPLWCYVW